MKPENPSARPLPGADVLFVSHCVPYPPDKGERIRAYHEVRFLSARYRVHVVCVSRDERERRSAEELNRWCASVRVVDLDPRTALVRGMLRFATGGCLNTAYFDSAALRRAIAETVSEAAPAVCVAYTAAVAPLVPANLPLLLDMVDVDSEKWFQYARFRQPSALFALEARRLRAVEQRLSERASHVWLTTANEARLYREFAPGARVDSIENGVDGSLFDPEAVAADDRLGPRPYIVFVGYLDYYPNRDAVLWFAREVLPALHRQGSGPRFLIVGRNAPPDVRRLDGTPHIEVVGEVADVRPFLKHAAAMVAPLRIARGIQNKVLEALVMGCPVLASDAVARTFGDEPPVGLLACKAADDYRAAWERAGEASRPEIREAARKRFDWDRNLEAMAEALAEVAGEEDSGQHSACRCRTATEADG